jgi:TrmH family RNA methyltransferase
LSLAARLAVVLVAPRNPLNIGAVARAMSNFDFSDLRVVNPYAVAFRQARSAVGASELLANAREFPNLAAAIADCTLVIGTTAGRARELQQPLHRLDQAAGLIRRHRGRIALLFGSEKRGLSNHDFSHCHWLLHIPTREQHVSMNLGQAVAVCLYEVARGAKPALAARKAAGKPAGKNAKPAPAAAIDRLTEILLGSLCVSGYLPEPASPASEEKIRRLVRRLRLSAADAELCLGMFRQIHWKLRSPKTP